MSQPNCTENPATIQLRKTEHYRRALNVLGYTNFALAEDGKTVLINGRSLNPFFWAEVKMAFRDAGYQFRVGALRDVITTLAFQSEFPELCS